MEGTSKPDQAALRKLWRRYHQEHDRIAAEWWALGITYPPPKYPPFPEELRGLTCGARTRAGTPCKRKDLYGPARCPLHGGLSTGPTTAEGMADADRQKAKLAAGLVNDTTAAERSRKYRERKRAAAGQPATS